MPLLFLDALPPNTTKGTIVRFLTVVGQLDRRKIGAIQLSGRSATVEVPETWIDRLIRSLDGENLGGRHVRVHRQLATGELDVEDPFQQMSRLLTMEAEAEARQTLGQLGRLTPQAAELTGNSIVELVVRDQTTGLGGRYLVTLGRATENQPLPWTRLGAGSPVLVSPMKARADTGQRGIVSQRSNFTIEVALGQLVDVDDPRERYRLDLTNDEIARQRQQAALQQARAAKGDRLAQLVDILWGRREPQFRDWSPLEPLDAGLNTSQREAIQHALAAEDVAIIHGPPGTGKTTTLVELIRQAVARGQTVLACAPSNMAVDNMLERLLAAGEQAVRLGHPARVLPQLREHTLDLIVDRHPDVALARKLARQASQLLDKAARFTRAKPAPGAKREMRDEARSLLDDARRIEAQVVQHVLDNAMVLCATTTALSSEVLGRRQFDLAVIDEACQSVEPGCWIPLLRCQRLVLAGDHRQLPPTIVSTEAAREGFAVSMLERLMDSHGSTLSRQLVVQYRMHERIMGFSSQEFYDGSLQADESVREHLLCDLPECESNELTATPLQFIDTAGAGFDEEIEPDGESRLNRQEAQWVGRRVSQLIQAGVPAAQLAVITPYSAQVRLLREQLLPEYPELEIDSVDGFQGREKEAVVISLVRSNADGQIGFLADYRRMNVALTRARRKLIVIGDSATIGHQPFYLRMLEYFEQHGAYTTVWSEQ